MYQFSWNANPQIIKWKFLENFSLILKLNIKKIKFSHFFSEIKEKKNYERIKKFVGIDFYLKECYQKLLSL